MATSTIFGRPLLLFGASVSSLADARDDKGRFRDSRAPAVCDDAAGGVICLDKFGNLPETAPFVKSIPGFSRSKMAKSALYFFMSFAYFS